MRFYLEKNLEKLARWLRFLGYNAYTIKGRIELKKVPPDGIFITTSRKWYEKLNKLGLQTFIVPRHDFELQLCSVIKHFRLRTELNLNLCAYCSAPLLEVDKKTVKERIPPRVYEEASDFTLCPDCGAVFWKGSHFKFMRKKLEKILRKC